MVDRIKVFAATEDIRMRLKHPAGKKFPPDIREGVLWPNDQFTLRRLRDGDITKDKPSSQQTEE